MNNNGDYFSFTADEFDSGKRIDVFLSEELEDTSRSRIQKLIEDGNIIVNNGRISKNYKLRTKDVIELWLPEPKPVEIKAENIELDVVYEDEDVIVINKPQGMVVHPCPAHYSGTVVNGLMYICGGSLSGINGLLRPGIVHRIDKDTSGIIVAAKNDIAHQKLAVQLAEHSMKRVYYALCFNGFSQGIGTVDKPIGRNPSDRKKMAVTDKNSKRAVTHYEVIEELGKYTLIKCTLETGRTHQIRVHMASIGHPLLGDTVYGSQKQPFKLSGQVLHAKVLGFIHPRRGEYMEFESELPQYFINLITKLRK